MNILQFKIIVVFVPLLIFGCSTKNVVTDQEVDPKSFITPTTTSNLFGSEIYIPVDLNDCFKELDKMLSSELKQAMKDSSQEYMINHHFSLGMWIRNNWGLWKGSRLSDYFIKCGIFHPDNMSGLILDYYWKHLHSERNTFDEDMLENKKRMSAKGIDIDKQIEEVKCRKIMNSVLKYTIYTGLVIAAYFSFIK